MRVIGLSRFLYPKILFSSPRYHLSSAAPSTSIDQGEISRFAALADSWWNEEGPFKALRSMNRLRVPWIRDTLLQVHRQLGHPEPSASSPLAGFRILDVGCGAGFLTEPLARLGASVVGIDPTVENIEVAKEHASRWREELGYQERLVYHCKTVEDLVVELEVAKDLAAGDSAGGSRTAEDQAGGFKSAEDLADGSKTSQDLVGGSKTSQGPARKSRTAGNLAQASQIAEVPAQASKIVKNLAQASKIVEAPTEGFKTAVTSSQEFKTGQHRTGDPKGLFDAVIASEVVEHVANRESFVDNCLRLVKPGGGCIFFTTINRTGASRLLAITMAENVLGIVPQGMHEWDKFTPPEDLQFLVEKNGDCNVRLVHGMWYNPCTNRWSWTRNTYVNYALCGVKK